MESGAGRQRRRSDDDLGGWVESGHCFGDGRMTNPVAGGKAAIGLCLVPFSQNALARGAVHAALPSEDEKVVLMHSIAGP